MCRVSVPSDRVALIGVGASSLVVDLVGRGYSSIDAVELSGAALDQLRVRLGESASVVRFVEADVRHVHFDELAVVDGLAEIDSLVDVWHDRATLHFLNDNDDQVLYAQRAAASVRIGGRLIIATFSLNGPEQCSGLPVTRHSCDSLRSLFAESFEMLESFEDVHVTPWGSNQAFTYAVFQRTAS